MSVASLWQHFDIGSYTWYSRHRSQGSGIASDQDQDEEIRGGDTAVVNVPTFLLVSTIAILALPRSQIGGDSEGFSRLTDPSRSN